MHLDLWKLYLTHHGENSSGRQHDGQPIESSIIFARRLGIDPEDDFNRHHRPRRAPRRVDEQAGTAAVLSLQQFYRKQLREVLDVLTSSMSEHLVQCKESLLPLLKCLQLSDVLQWERGGTPFPHYFRWGDAVPPDKNKAWGNAVPLTRIIPPGTPFITCDVVFELSELSETLQHRSKN